MADENGDKAFAAGTDIAQFRSFSSAEDALAYEERIETVIGTIESCPVPTLAAISGAFTGGGAAIGLACDLRIAEQHAQLALPEASVGLLPCAGGTQALPWLVGEGWAKRMILCGERVDAQTALQIGLVEQLAAQATPPVTQRQEKIDQRAEGPLGQRRLAGQQHPAHMRLDIERVARHLTGEMPPCGQGIDPGRTVEPAGPHIGEHRIDRPLDRSLEDLLDCAHCHPLARPTHRIMCPSITAPWCISIAP